MSINGINLPAAKDPICPICAQPLPADAAPLSEIDCPTCGKKVLVPGMLNQFRLTKLLGQGGMGVVFEGIDEGLDRPVAVKFILREKVEEDPEFKERFAIESKAIGKFNSDYIVRTNVNGEWEGQPYLVMELVKADALDRMMERGRVSPVTALNIGIEIAEGLSQAATFGLVHGDVKPENILLDDHHHAKLADFGIASAASALAAENNEVWGTPYYIAPEKLRKQKVDARADMFSLGGTLYHAIAGVPPFDGDDAAATMRARLEHEAEPLQRHVPNCPEAIVKVIMRMLSTEPARRHPNYEALINDMKRALPKAGSLSGKHIMLKPKKTTQVATADAMPSRPMAPVVPQRLAEDNLFADEEAELAARKKKIILLASCIGGGALLLLTGVIILMLSLSGGDTKSTPADTAPAAITVDPRIALRKSATALNTEATATLDTLSRYGKEADGIVKRLAKRAERAVLPEEQQWLSKAEGEAPSEMLKELQSSFTATAALQTLADEADALKQTLAAELEKATDRTADASTVESALTTMKEAVDAFMAKPEVQSAKATLAALESRNARWQRTVDAARTEMEARVKARIEAEKKAAAEQKRLDEEARKKAAVEAEVNSISEIAAAMNEPLNQFNPTEALNQFKHKTALLKSTEAKEAAAQAKKQLELYDDFQKWIIANAKKGTFNNLGITAADPRKGITVKGTTLPWVTFAVDHNVLAFRMIDSYIRDDRGAQALSASERARLSLAALLFADRFFNKDNVAKSAVMQSMIKRLDSLAEVIPAVVELKKTFLNPEAFPAHAPAAKAEETTEAPAAEKAAPAAEEAPAEESGDDWGWGE